MDKFGDILVLIRWNVGEICGWFFRCRCT